VIVTVLSALAYLNKARGLIGAEERELPPP